MMTKPSLPEPLLQALRAYQPEKAILFGSAARGDTDAFSDIDLILIKKTPKMFIQRLVDFGRLLPPDAPRVDAFVYTPEEFAQMRDDEYPFMVSALKDAIVVYEAPTRGA